MNVLNWLATLAVFVIAVRVITEFHGVMLVRITKPLYPEEVMRRVNKYLPPVVALVIGLSAYTVWWLPW